MRPEFLYNLCRYIFFQVIPFLILAVGVDNMFLIVNSCTKMMDQNKDIVLCIAESLRSIGPSLLLTTLSEAACFVIGNNFKNNGLL